MSCVESPTVNKTQPLPGGNHRLVGISSTISPRGNAWGGLTAGQLGSA